MKLDSSVTAEKTVTYGRPRLLTHEEILQAAVDLGLEGLSMKRLATKLNVGTATLYQYFESRKTLMRAAAVYALSDVKLPEDTGQHWSVYAREFVDSLQSLLSANPSYIHSHQHSDYGFEVQFKLIEQFLSVLDTRGFSPDEGMRVFNIVGLAGFAGATEAVRQAEFEQTGETMAEVAGRQFNRLDQNEFSLLKDAMSGFTQSPKEKVTRMLDDAFASIARDRGENIEAVLKGSEK